MRRIPLERTTRRCTARAVALLALAGALLTGPLPAGESTRTGDGATVQVQIVINPPDESEGAVSPLGIDPPQLLATALPGYTTYDYATVSNPGPSSRDVSLEILPLDDGAPDPLLADWSSHRWITISSHDFTLPPGRDKSVQLRFRLPLDAPPSCFAWLRLRASGDGAAPAFEQTIPVVARNLDALFAPLHKLWFHCLGQDDRFALDAAFYFPAGDAVQSVCRVEIAEAGGRAPLRRLELSPALQCDGLVGRFTGPLGLEDLPDAAYQIRAIVANGPRQLHVEKMQLQIRRADGRMILEFSEGN